MQMKVFAIFWRAFILVRKYIINMSFNVFSYIDIPENSDKPE